MPYKNKTNPFMGAAHVVKDSLRVIKNHPEILLYPYGALLFVSISFPIVSASIFARWYGKIFTQTDVFVPGKTGAIVGLLGFSAFYTAIVTAYFTCAVSAAVMAKLDGRSTRPFYGLLEVGKNFFRVTRFALLSVFFLPLGIYSQRRKLPKGVIGVMGSSVTLHMAQAAPAILRTDKGISATIRDSVTTLGKLWREGLILKISMYLGIFFIVALPKLIQHGFFKSPSASNIGWLISLEIATSGYVTLKVINGIFTTVLYHQALNKK